MSTDTQPVKKPKVGGNKETLQDHIESLSLIKFYQCLPDKYQGDIKRGSKHLLVRLLYLMVDIGTGTQSETIKKIAGAQIVPVKYVATVGRKEVQFAGKKGYTHKVAEFGDTWYLLPIDYDLNSIPD